MKKHVGVEIWLLLLYVTYKGKMILNDSLERTWKDAAAPYFRVMSLAILLEEIIKIARNFIQDNGSLRKQNLTRGLQKMKHEW
jgi:hypothetical protein